MAFFDRNSGSKPRRFANTPDTFEHKTVTKKQRMKEGFIWAEGMIAPRPVTIRDMSLLEAEISLWNDDVKLHLLTGRFKLYSCSEKKEVECILAGKKGDSLGLRFTGRFHEPTRRYA